ncbi:TRAP transporter large permease subunit [Mesobacillus campisalis]|uniref:TRAP transporter large permease subunit n=1 Tax=Mesobacillus campisalis TaxID=1408103 RepID=UPI00069CA289|nr:TRAP transporter large permease subunit [Mesobacillus campisalis]
MPTTAVYVTVAVILAPALQELGLSALQAHMFAFFYGVVAAITPPIALASFAAASISKTHPMKTSFVAFRLGLAGFIIPFMFAYGPELLLQGKPLDIALAVITAIVGLYLLTAAIIGFYWNAHINLFTRLILFAGSLLTLYPGIISDFIGVGIALVMYMVTRKGSVSIIVKTETNQS